MKFHNDVDAKKFVLEIGRADLVGTANKDLKPTDEMMGLLHKSRKSLTSGIKSFRRSQAAKGNWRKYSAEMMRGIKSFHKSTEGKRFHRNLGRFITRKIFTGSLTGRKLGSMTEENDLSEKADALKAISSIITHLLVEMEYYHPLHEQMGIDEMIMEHMDDLYYIKRKVLSGMDLTEENSTLLILLTEKSEIIKSFSFRSGKSEDDIEGMWNKIKDSLISQGKEESDDNFYAILVGSVKKALKLK